MVSKNKIKELKQIIQGEYGQDLPFEIVSEIANGLVGFYSELVKIDSYSGLIKIEINVTINLTTKCVNT